MTPNASANGSWLGPATDNLAPVAPPCYPAGMIIITGHVRLKPEHREAAFAEGIVHSRRSRAEPGCLAHNCHTDAEDPDRMVFVEEWADMAAVKAHFAVPESGAFVRAVGAMAAEAPVMRIFEARELDR